MENKKRKIHMFNRGELLRTLENWNSSPGMLSCFREIYGKELKPNRKDVKEFEEILRSKFIYEMNYDEFSAKLDYVLKAIFPGDNVIGHLVEILRKNYEHLVFVKDGSFLHNRILFKDDCCSIRHRSNKRTENLYINEFYITSEAVDEAFDDLLQNYETIPVQFCF